MTLEGVPQREIDEFRNRYLVYGEDQLSICRNATLSKRAYETVKSRYDALVDDLSDGLVIDFEGPDGLEQTGRAVYIAQAFCMYYNPGWTPG